jgi:hypothetical protein
VLDARNHYPQIKHHTPPPKQGDNQSLSPVSHTRDEEIAGLLSQSPIVCLAIPSPQTRTKVRTRCGSSFVVHQNHTHYRCSPSNESPRSPNPRTMQAGHGSRGAP